MPRNTFRNVFVTDELISQIHPQNKKFVEKFLREKSTRSSKTTIGAYESDANIFMVWNVLHNDNKLFTDIRKLELAEFFSFAVDELKWGSSRCNRVRSFLSSLSIFIEKFFDSEYPQFHNLVLKTIESVPKELRREKTILSERQVNDLLQHLSETDSQKACWVALAAYSGSRFSELLRFTTDILDENHTAFGDLFMETLKPIKTKGRGRDGKLLYKYILKDKFLPYYKKWLEDRKIIMDKCGCDHNFIFIKQDGSPATDGTIRYWVMAIENYLQVPFYPHLLRHYLVTEFAKKNIPPMLIKDLVGWSGLEMVSLYDDTSSKDKVWAELENLK